MAFPPMVILFLNGCIGFSCCELGRCICWRHWHRAFALWDGLKMNCANAGQPCRPDFRPLWLPMPFAGRLNWLSIPLRVLRENPWKISGCVSSVFADCLFLFFAPGCLVPTEKTSIGGLSLAHWRCSLFSPSSFLEHATGLFLTKKAMRGLKMELSFTPWIPFLRKSRTLLIKAGSSYLIPIRR